MRVTRIGQDIPRYDMSRAFMSFALEIKSNSGFKPEHK